MYGSRTRPYYRRIRRTPWTVDQWRAFGLRCQQVRREYDELIHQFPQTEGLTTQHINLLVKADSRFFAAMLQAENAYAEQHPDHDNDAIPTIHGRDGKFQGFCRGRVPSSAKPLSREEWQRWGDRTKVLRAEIMALQMEFQKTAVLARSRMFGRATDALDLARCKLDSLVCNQHRGWEGAVDVFYGQPPAALAPVDQAG